MTKMRRWPVALVLLAAPALAIDITAPGQTVPRGQVGVLQADLACAPSAMGVFLDDGATLEMNGHALDGCFVGGAGLSRVDIAVRGPGLIRNAGIAFRGGTLRARDIAIQDSPSFGIAGGAGAVLRLQNVTVTGSGADGIVAAEVVARDVTSSGNGVAGTPLSPPFGSGVIGYRSVKGRNLIVSGNSAEGVRANSVTLRDSQVTGNALNGNALGGVIGFGALTIIRSTVTGNDAQGGKVDLLSQRKPRVRDSTCGSSLDAQAQVPWGVCAND